MTRRRVQQVHPRRVSRKKPWFFFSNLADEIDDVLPLSQGYLKDLQLDVPICGGEGYIRRAFCVLLKRQSQSPREVAFILVAYQ